MKDVRKIFGDAAENLAAEYLVRHGMRIIARQFRTVFGEIDLIAMEGDEIVFVEVKARQTDEYGYPEAAVTPSKLRKIANAGLMYLREEHKEDVPYRIDVVAIEYYIDPPRVTHLRAVS